MAMVASPSCPSSEYDCATSSALQDADVSLRCDELWSEVELAERYLISSRHDEAAVTSLAALRKLKDSCGLFEYNGDVSRHSRVVLDENEVADIIESAAMVVIQALDESGRSRIIFKDLETIFGCLAMVPSSVFLAGLCLQISANLFLDAQMSVESYLNHWAFPSSGDHLCKPKLSLAQNIVFLNRQEYLKIANIYCIKVLAQGLGRVDHAVHWVKEAEIPSETKQDMLKRLEESSSRVDRKDERDLSCHERVGRGLAAEPVTSSTSSAYVNLATQARATKQDAKQADSQALLKTFPFCFYVMEVISGCVRSSSADRAAKWNKTLTFVHQGKPILSGAALTFVIIALYKQRLNLSRVMGRLGKVIMRFARAVYMGLFDFWQLAFNVQLNPLAAVQPLPHAHNAR